MRVHAREIIEFFQKWKPGFPFLMISPDTRIMTTPSFVPIKSPKTERRVGRTFPSIAKVQEGVYDLGGWEWGVRASRASRTTGQRHDEKWILIGYTLEEAVAWREELRCRLQGLILENIKPHHVENGLKVIDEMESSPPEVDEKTAIEILEVAGFQILNVRELSTGTMLEVFFKRPK